MHSDSIQKALLETDTHTHTIASTHAFSTILEMAHFAAQKDMKAIAVTDHGPAIPDGAHEWHFGSMRTLPPYIEGVRVLHGVEANIMDYEGTLDICERYQKELDWVVASYHDPCCDPGTVEQHTASYLKVAENPYVDVIGHSGTGEYRYDYEKVIPVFKQKGKLVEINSHSFSTRSGAAKNCREIALICKKHEVPIVVNSDAHSCFVVGDLQDAIDMLKDIAFPKELIVNRTLKSLADWIFKKRGRNIL